MRAAKVVKRGEQRGGAHGLAVERDAVALLETDLDIFGGVGRVFRMVGARIDVIWGLFPRILEHLAFGRGVQQVRIGRERAFAALVLGHSDLVLFRPCDQRGAAGQVPFAPRGNDRDVRVERIGREFEADLVVALARGTMRDRISIGFPRDFDQAFGNQRPRDAGAEQVVAFIPSIGTHHREDEVAHELLAQVLDVDVLVGNAHCTGFLARGFDFLALSQIGGEGHHFEPALDLEPLGDDRGIETTGIGEDDAFDIGHWGTFTVRGAPLAGRGGSRQSIHAWAATSGHAPMSWPRPEAEEGG